MRLAVLDVGSNTVHLLVVDAHEGARPLPANSDKTELQLAEHLTDDGRIDDAGRERLVRLRCSTRWTSPRTGAPRTCWPSRRRRCARRRTAPRSWRRSASETGVDLEVLTGDDEARLTFLAVRRWFGWSSGRLLVLDIGGGSLEIAAGIDELPDAIASLPLGAGRLTRDAAARRPAVGQGREGAAQARAHRGGRAAAPVRGAGRAGPRGRDLQDVQAAGPPHRRPAVVGGRARAAAAHPRRPRTSGCRSSPR